MTHAQTESAADLFASTPAEALQNARLLLWGWPRSFSLSNLLKHFFNYAKTCTKVWQVFLKAVAARCTLHHIQMARMIELYALQVTRCAFYLQNNISSCWHTFLYDWTVNLTKSFEKSSSSLYLLTNKHDLIKGSG